MLIRAHLRNVARHEPHPRYILILTHWQAGTPRSGNAVLVEASALYGESGGTVVMTMRTPKDRLKAAADRFAVLGPNVEQVVTVLVEDT